MWCPEVGLGMLDSTSERSQKKWNQENVNRPLDTHVGDDDGDDDGDEDDKKDNDKSDEDDRINKMC